MRFRRWRLALVAGIILLAAGHGSSYSQETITIWIDGSVPPDFADMVAPLFAEGNYQQAQSAEAAQVQVKIAGETLNSTWVYVPVMAFATYYAERTSFDDIERYWHGENTALNRLSPNNVPLVLVITPPVLATMTVLLGQPEAAQPLQVVPEEQLVTALWRNRPNAWSIVPFHDLIPELKVLALDEFDVFSPAFDAQSYPLAIQVGLAGDSDAVAKVATDLAEVASWQNSNRAADKMTRVVLSGVTAMTRVTAYYMEQLGITHPGEGILPFLSDADIFHTSNEVAFATNCPPPIRDWASTTFCSDDRYLELLQYIGLDVVELTGNHVNDYGGAAFEHTLQMYEVAGIAYFGGGRTPEQARAAWITEHHGNSIAFIGCNKPGPQWAWASAERGGAAQCDADYLQAELGRLSATVDVVIMSVQDFEFNQYNAPPAQVERFRTLAGWGADVVIGTQAHQPQGFELLEREGQPSAFLHHGLGNLFFDQIQRIENREMFLDKLIIYDGRVINVVLFTGIIDDYCCPRPMAGGERRIFLANIFRASGW